jgi:diguanylate cyclase (GGDEF)-like protein
VVGPSANAVSSYSEISEAWLLGRARELLAVAQRTDPITQQDILSELNDLLEETLRRADPRSVGQMLRHNIQARLIVSPHDDYIDPLMDEMLALGRRHSLVVLEAGAHALRGHRALFASAVDTAVTEVALALAMLDEDPIPDLAADNRGWRKLYAAVLLDIGLTLTQLGVYEEADRVIIRADAAIHDGGGPHEIALHLINRVRLQLGWGLWSERIGREGIATERFATAAAMAAAAEGPFQESLFPRDPDLNAADQVHDLGAAHALSDPGEHHLERLYGLLNSAATTRDVITVAIALARCLAVIGRADDAIEVLADIRERLADDHTEPALRLSLVREFAHLSGPDGGERTTSALEDYAAELEAQLDATQGSRIATLATRREHERLAREHGAIAIQALQDPLTGLPNRRALDERLAELVANPAMHPVAIGLIDVDGFKEVNDQSSHAEGDEVLRLLAGTLRDALRGDDMVARYGGDEFVALLPGAPLSAAEAALNRAVRAVANLPTEMARGVTLSVGVVSLLPHETAAQVLSRADAAMYLAKRAGGNSVRAMSSKPANTDVDSDGALTPLPYRAADIPLATPEAQPKQRRDEPRNNPFDPSTGRTWMMPDSS